MNHIRILAPINCHRSLLPCGQKILECGGELWFEKKVVDFHLDNGKITGVITAEGDIYQSDAVILATGHSARDIFQLLYTKKIGIEFKPFALGVRVEHPQSLIDSVQYHRNSGYSSKKDVLQPIYHLLPTTWFTRLTVKECFHFVCVREVSSLPLLPIPGNW